MIAIKPAPREQVEAICREKGFLFGEDVFVCQAGEEEWILFQLRDGVCTLWEAVCQPFLLDALVRSALNLADLRGVERYTAGGRMAAHWGEKLQALGYPAGEGNIISLFAKGCGHGKGENNGKG